MFHVYKDLNYQHSHSIKYAAASFTHLNIRKPATHKPNSNLTFLPLPDNTVKPSVINMSYYNWLLSNHMQTCLLLVNVSCPFVSMFCSLIYKIVATLGNSVFMKLTHVCVLYFDLAFES